MSLAFFFRAQELWSKFRETLTYMIQECASTPWDANKQAGTVGRVDGDGSNAVRNESQNKHKPPGVGMMVLTSPCIITDKTRPACGRCLSSGHHCSGYDAPLRMEILGIQSGDDGTKRLTRISPPPVCHTAGVVAVGPRSNNADPAGTRHGRFPERDHSISKAAAGATFGSTQCWRPRPTMLLTLTRLQCARLCTGMPA
jgi:hypothetical protein